MDKKTGWLSYDLCRWAYLAVILGHDYGRDHLVLLLLRVALEEQYLDWFERGITDNDRVCGSVEL